MVESQFLGMKPKKRKKSRKKRENYVVTVLNPVKAKGRYPKGQGLNKGNRIKGRSPIRGDRMFTNPDAVWLGMNLAPNKAQIIDAAIEATKE